MFFYICKELFEIFSKLFMLLSVNIGRQCLPQYRQRLSSIVLSARERHKAVEGLRMPMNQFIDILRILSSSWPPPSEWSTLVWDRFVGGAAPSQGYIKPFYMKTKRPATGSWGPVAGNGATVEKYRDARPWNTCSESFWGCGNFFQKVPTKKFPTRTFFKNFPQKLNPFSSSEWEEQWWSRR